MRFVDVEKYEKRKIIILIMMNMIMNMIMILLLESTLTPSSHCIVVDIKGKAQRYEKAAALTFLDVS